MPISSNVQKNVYRLLVPLLLFNSYFVISYGVCGFEQITDNTVVLNPYEYHIISVNATKNQALSGDFSVTPADLLTAPFLVFIIDDSHLSDWLASDNLTQAIKRLPSDEVLYLYDPLFKLDDFPLDGYRTGSFNVKAPHLDEWHLVLYAGASLIPLTFSWHLDVFEGYLMDIAFGIIGGVIMLAFVSVIGYKMIKDRNRSYEEEFNEIINETKDSTNEDKGLGSLELEDEESFD